VVVSLGLGASAVAPSAAGAFVGESVVLNPAKTDLTGPAKTILTNPTFLPETTEGAAALGGVAEESAAAGVFQGAGILPALGSVLSFGVGTVIGSEICKVIGIEGCWYFGSEGPDPADGSVTYNWEWKGATGSIPFSWWWSRGMANYKGLEGTAGDCGNDVPGGMDTFVVGSASLGCHSEANHKVEPFRYSMSNREFSYHPSDDPGVSNYSYSAPSNWSENLAKELKEKGEGTVAGRLGQHIASKIEGSKVVSPYPHEVTVPSCSGEAWIGCKEDLEELQLKPERKELDWSDAHLDLAPDEVVELDPAPGTKIIVPTETKTIVTTNPDEGGMPLVVPDPAEGETYSDYITKLAPGLNPERHNVGEGFTDPHVGPNSVLRTHPDPGTRLDPSIEHDVEVETNPPDAPPAAGVWTAPSIPALDLSPLSGVSIGCNAFPFGVFCWVADGLTNWGSEGECPSFDLPFTSEIRDSTADLTFDTCTFEPAMNIIRPMLVILSFFGVAWLLSASAMGLGGGASADD
jgi:hypothetical protein